jgi:hypothetical protein
MSQCYSSFSENVEGMYGKMWFFVHSPTCNKFVPELHHFIKRFSEYGGLGLPNCIHVHTVDLCILVECQRQYTCVMHKRGQTCLHHHDTAQWLLGRTPLSPVVLSQSAFIYTDWPLHSVHEHTLYSAHALV